jgi:hypothetical protein
METDVALPKTAGIFQNIADATGLSLISVEIGILLLVLILFLIVITVLLAILRIRRETISLNFKLGYIARLLKREFEGPAPKKEPVPKKESEPEESFKEEWKF